MQAFEATNFYFDQAAKLLDVDARGILARVTAQLQAVQDWSVPALEAAVRAFAEQGGHHEGGHGLHDRRQ